jgi:hypothetical protein
MCVALSTLYKKKISNKNIINITKKILQKYKNSNKGGPLEQCVFGAREVMLAAFPANQLTNSYKCIFLASKDLAGLIIGKNGQRIEGLKKRFDVQITLSPPQNKYQVDEEIMMTGNLDNIAGAVNTLNDTFRVAFRGEEGKKYPQPPAPWEAGRYNNFLLVFLSFFCFTFGASLHFFQLICFSGFFWFISWVGPSGSPESSKTE